MKSVTPCEGVGVEIAGHSLRDCASGHALRGRGSRNQAGGVFHPSGCGHALRGRGSRNQGRSYSPGI